MPMLKDASRRTRCEGRVAFGLRILERLVDAAFFAVFFARSDPAPTLSRRAMPTVFPCADAGSAAITVTSSSTFYAAWTGSIGLRCSSDKPVLRPIGRGAGRRLP